MFPIVSAGIFLNSQQNFAIIVLGFLPKFANHESFAKELKADVYFARPYHSWERGLNENTNGLIRQYFPKGTDFRKVTHEQLNFVMTRLNNRPRKSLGFRTPNEVFYKPLTRKDSFVALVS